MTTEVWLALIACIGLVVKLVHYMVTKLSDSNTEVIKAYTVINESFKKEVKKVQDEFYQVKSLVESLKAQLVSAQRGMADNNSQMKRFIELTNNYIQDSEKRMKVLEEGLGKIIKVGK